MPTLSSRETGGRLCGRLRIDFGAAAAPQPWPAAGGAWLTVLGPAGAPGDEPPPVRYDAAAARLVLPWGEMPLT